MIELTSFAIGLIAGIGGTTILGIWLLLQAWKMGYKDAKKGKDTP